MNITVLEADEHSICFQRMFHNPDLLAFTSWDKQYNKINLKTGVFVCNSVSFSF